LSTLNTIQFNLFPEDNERLQNLSGWQHEHFGQVELGLGVEINSRGFQLSVTGQASRVGKAEQVIRELYNETEQQTLTPDLCI